MAASGSRTPARSPRSGWKRWTKSSRRLRRAFITNAAKGDKPFFVWFNATRMHIWTHLQPKSVGVTGLGVYPDGMVEHDALVGRLLGLLDSLGIADNTIVMYSTDNGAEKFSWPDGGASPFRNEKASNWEGAYRVPGMIRWPGTIKPGTVLNDIVSHEDWVPDARGGRRQPHGQGTAAHRLHRRPGRPSRCISTATT